jgi:hypothetical protein
MPKMTRLWHNEIGGPPSFRRLELRIDFDNDRHHAVQVEPPYSVSEVAMALHTLARNIANDPKLRSTNGR